ncbi:hypothetical protein CANCADRAFT_110742 [Tortispora caseinolytica NRRL Y-17796]|uniref:HD/PDEase domain-containing protein n=1 Tax=Tortispora caseinolytica NRRL Y-17796 TaxID=767744 RepID=A0A1E4TGE1_9ASCO|nr:hypothetical protein CANCADRAFT_110742 [Tortispora caseinolytica NRRL Y-17796]
MSYNFTTPIKQQTSFHRKTPTKTAYRSPEVNLTETTIEISDIVYGEVTIDEKVLVDLISSPDFQRLKGVMQYGLSSTIPKLGVFPVSRYEHSIGAMLLVRRLGGAVEEQISALLHDISHTAMSHTLDVAFPDEGGSFHEVYKWEYLKRSQIPQILESHNYDFEVVCCEENYPLVERSTPALCADRVDYGIRDAMVYNLLTVSDAKELLNDLQAFPSADLSDPNRAIVFKTAEIAAKFAEAYRNTDVIGWSDPLSGVCSSIMGEIIRTAVKANIISKFDLWITDDELWKILRSYNNEKIATLLYQLDNVDSCQIVHTPDSNTIMLEFKRRRVNPPVRISSEKSMPLSQVAEEFSAAMSPSSSPFTKVFVRLDPNTPSSLGKRAALTDNSVLSV